MILDIEIREELELIINSLKELLDREWAIFGSKKHNVDSSKISELFNKIKELGIYQYLNQANPVDAYLINEILGQYLVPSIVAFTSMASKAILGEEGKEIIEKGYAISVGSNVVPDIDKADIVLTPHGIAFTKEISASEVKSPDPSVRLFNITEANWKKADIDFNSIKLIASSQMIGHAMACLNKTIDYAKNRIAFGKPIGSYQAVKHKIVDDAVNLELARSLYLSQRTNLTPDRVFNHTFKVSLKAIFDSIQLHGGIGFTTDLDLHLHLKRLLLLYKILQ
jgi:hypothetical protein